ncbi:hypothetical protein CROQUDRAFT_107923 [Cronartium quercuum f. sp. fusiforme G11]|uniref:AFG1-like ATPase n=1 Tax=Cronartium quercuum f. sp. fusiforme G11 TaxID=708437 RepID=A0A9P6NJR3_9BASI|nr:hypothetical protein CROQUDRAFT_107923 [Cronartium quercuum f. sp. fusiforme G11]
MNIRPFTQPINRQTIRSQTSHQLALQPTDLLQLYQHRLTTGILRADPDQLRVIYQLRALHNSIKTYNPHPRLLSLFDQAYLAPNQDYSKHPAYTPDPDVLGLSPSQRRNALVKVLKTDSHPADEQAPLGFLLTGPPGTGKSLLMDLFFQSLPTARKLRRHYHHFLLELYSLVFARLESRRISLDPGALESQLGSPIGSLPPRQDSARNKALSDGWRSVFAGGADPKDPVLNGPDFVLAQVARDLIVHHGWILAFDEIQMVDVAGAGLLSRVLEWYWRLGGIVLGTSNRVPEHMYDEGVQKSTVLPFLNRLKLKSPTIELGSKRDWRRELAAEVTEQPKPSTWHVGYPSANWYELIRTLVPNPQPTHLRVYGRTIEFKRANLDTQSVVVSYKELCEAPLGPADYLTLTSNFQTILVEDIPVFTSLMKNEARRFITFLDAAYECQVALHINAAAEIDRLFFPDSQPIEEHDPMKQESMSEIVHDLLASHRPHVSTYSAPGAESRPSLDAPLTDGYARLAIFTGQDEQYAFQRAVSRLYELTRSGGSGKAWAPMALDGLWNKKSQPQSPPSGISSANKKNFGDDQGPSPRRPWISPNHIWGIAQWGKRAGRWGKGAKVYEKEPNKD